MPSIPSAPAARPRRHRTWFAIAAAALALAALLVVVYRPDLALRVATGTAAHDLCSETFVSGLDPDQVFAEALRPRPGFRLVAWAMRYAVDRDRAEVRASLAGALASRAVYRPGAGCLLLAGEPPAAPPEATAPPPAAPDDEVAAPPEPRLEAALDAAFAEPAAPPHEWTKAVVVRRAGRIVAERYAPGYGVDTPILGFSLAKSVTSALVGVLVRAGRLDLHGAAPVPAWQGAGDPRRAITLEQLLRMTSGLALDETGSGFDPPNRMFYLAPDMASFAARARLEAAPGTRWAYSSASVHLAARAVRDAVGGDGAAARRFAAEALFAPLGMRHVTMEADATGTPVGAHYVLASARDWSRLGELYLDDGVAAGRRLLPEGWVALSTQPTLDGDYGMGWWANRTRAGGEPGQGMPLLRRAPPDTFYGLGNLGQYLAVVPSARLVVVRLGRSHAPHFDVARMDALVAACVAAASGGGP